MLKFIHLTDTHLVPAKQALWGLDPAWRLRRAVQSINRHHADAEFCVVTGDLTHYGQREAYVALAEELSQLVVPCLHILGNHDHRATFCSIFGDASVDTNGFVQFVRSAGELGRCVFLDTNEPGVHHGVFCEKRAEWLRARLSENTGDKVTLFMHHPPFNVELPSMDQYSLLDPSHFRRAIDGHESRIRHIFFGHVHRPICGAWRGISFSTLRGTNHQVALDFDAKTLIRGSHEPPQYGVVFMDLERLIVHMHDYLYRGETFMMDGSKEFLEYS